MTDIGAYPSRWESHVVVSDGGTVYLRPIKPTDGPGIEALHGRLSPETIYFRFFTPLPKLSEAMLYRFVNVDYVDRYAVVALLGDVLIAVARYDRIPGSSEAEVAFLVDDAHQGRGLGTIMLEHLAAVAKEWGISRFVADTLPENSRMIRVFHDAGFQEHSAFQDGVVRVSFSIATTDASLGAMYERERRAAVRSVRRLLAPRSVAVVGASRVVGSVGYLLLRNILESNFQGVVYPINPNADSISGVPAYKRLTDVPGPIDLAVIAVAKESIAEVIREAGELHVGALVIVSAGFSEMSYEGAIEESHLVRMARRNGMRVVGAASMGVATMTPGLSLNATLSPRAPLPGRAALHSQSGALSLAILEEARRRGLGISSFVSSGNKADISGNDLLHYFEDDPDTSVIMLYIEDFGNPRNFSRIARRVTAHKPIIAVKSGGQHRNDLGLGHDGSSDTDSSIVDVLFDRTGVIRVETLAQLFELANAMVAQPLPTGRRVGILSNVGGPAPLCADACRSVGLELPELSSELTESLSALGAVRRKRTNPVELAIGTSPNNYREALLALLDSGEVDAVIALYIPTVVGTPEAPSTLESPSPDGRLRGTPEIASDFAAQVAHGIAEAVARQKADPPRPVLANFLSLPGVAAGLGGAERPVPTFSFPESAAIALSRMVQYAEWRRRPKGTPLHQDDEQRLRARSIIDRSMVQRRGEPRATERTSLAIDARDLSELCTTYGLPIVAPDVLSTTISTVPHARIRISYTHHRIYGPSIELGLSGEIAELIGERRRRALPQTDLEIDELIESMAGSRILSGYRAIPPLDKAAFHQVLHAVTNLVEEAHEVTEIIIDPLVITEYGAQMPLPVLTLDDWAPEPAYVTRALRSV
jgi:acyl-CoA synthetase (NDP forming)/RimJ/RimL family protein N-acetyltransferase